MTKKTIKEWVLEEVKDETLNLEEVVKTLEPIFSNMEGAVIIHTALLIFQINITTA